MDECGTLHIVLVVTGMRRSGTSMWMRILHEAGIPVIGEAFPADWEKALGAANANGFYESTLREGVNYTTNPDPRSGRYMHPDECKLHALKIFAEGLGRTDLAFLDRVLVTVRPWRHSATSLRRLIDLENQARGISDADRPPGLAPVLAWWEANFGIVRDIVLRRYPVHIMAYSRVVRDPQGVVPQVLRWFVESEELFAQLNVDSAVAVVAPPAKKAKPLLDDEQLGVTPAIARHLPVFDEFYAAIEGEQGLSEQLLERMNKVHAALTPLLAAYQKELVDYLGRLKPGESPVSLMALDDERGD